MLPPEVRVTVWVVVRLVKFGAMLALTAGMAGVLAHGSRARRLSVVYGMVLPAFLAVWTAGYLLMQHTDRGFEPWILASMTTSLIALHSTLLVAHRPAPRSLTAAIGWGAIAGTVVLMGIRDVAPLTLGIAALATLGVLGATAAWGRAPVDADPSTDPDRLARRAILWTGRVEGISLLLLLAVSVGRRVLDVDLGLGPRVLGWVHGALVLIWFQVLWAGGRAVGWSWGTIAWGTIAALLPFGPFVFERGKG